MPNGADSLFRAVMERGTTSCLCLCPFVMFCMYRPGVGSGNGELRRRLTAVFGRRGVSILDILCAVVSVFIIRPQQSIRPPLPCYEDGSHVEGMYLLKKKSKQKPRLLKAGNCKYY